MGWHTVDYDVSKVESNWCEHRIIGMDPHAADLIRLLDAEGDGSRTCHCRVALVPEPDNPHVSDGRAMSVRWRDRVIGYLEPETAEKYWGLSRLAAGGHRAVTSARIDYRPEFAIPDAPAGAADGEYPEPEEIPHFTGAVSLSGPDACIPLNDPPAEGWTLLPAGPATQVTKEADHLDVLLDYVPPTGYGQLLVTLHEFVGGVRKLYPGVEVRVDGERIGELTKGSSQKFVTAVRHYSQLELTTAARAFITGSSLSAEVVLRAARAHELAEGDLEPEVSPLPRLVPYRADPDDYDVPDAWSGHPGDRPVEDPDPYAEPLPEPAGTDPADEGGDVPGGDAGEEHGDDGGEELLREYRRLITGQGPSPFADPVYADPDQAPVGASPTGYPDSPAVPPIQQGYSVAYAGNARPVPVQAPAPTPAQASKRMGPALGAVLGLIVIPVVLLFVIAGLTAMLGLDPEAGEADLLAGIWLLSVPVSPFVGAWWAKRRRDRPRR